VEFTLLWAAVTAAGFLWLGVRIWPEHLPDHPVDRLIGASAGGLLVGRLVAMVAQGTSPLSHPGDVLLVRGGVHTAAATVGAVGIYLWSVRGRIGFLDASAPAAILGLAGWHAGCLWRGACLGAASDLPWAWSLPSSSIDRHPVELYASGALMAGAFVVSKLSMQPLLRTGTALAVAAAVRLLTEPLRLSVTGGPGGWYALGIVVGLGAVAAGHIFGPRIRARPT